MRTSIAFALAASLVSMPAVADVELCQKPCEPAVKHSSRELNGHVFAPSLLVDSPFAETTFKIGLIYGAGSATGPKYDLQGNVVGTNDYSFAILDQNFSYEGRILDWLTAGIRIDAAMYSGLSGASLISIGAQFGLGIAADVKVTRRFGPVQGAFRIEVSNGPQFGLLFANALREAILNGTIDASAALDKRRSLIVNPALLASWAPFTALGFTLNAGYILNSLNVKGTHIADQNGIQVAGVADFDFGKVTGAAIGLLGGYRAAYSVGGDGVPTTQDVAFGISYTGRSALALGLEVGARWFKIRENLDSKGVVAQLGLQYYW